MDDQRLLYILFDNKEPYLKIGIATDEQRFKELSRYYNIDFDNSIFYKGQNQDIQDMERILHKTFKKRNVIREGSGGTEWFCSDIYNNIKLLIEQYQNVFGFSISNSKPCLELIKKNKRKSTKRQKCYNNNENDKIFQISDTLWFDVELTKSEIRLLLDFFILDEKIRFDLTKKNINSGILLTFAYLNIIEESMNQFSKSSVFRIWQDGSLIRNSSTFLALKPIYYMKEYIPVIKKYIADNLS